MWQRNRAAGSTIDGTGSTRRLAGYSASSRRRPRRLPGRSIVTRTALWPTRSSRSRKASSSAYGRGLNGLSARLRLLGFRPDVSIAGAAGTADDGGDVGLLFTSAHTGTSRSQPKSNKCAAHALLRRAACSPVYCTVRSEPGHPLGRGASDLASVTPPRRHRLRVPAVSYTHLRAHET